MTMITPSAQLTLTKGNKSWVPGPPSRSTVSMHNVPVKWTKQGFCKPYATPSSRQLSDSLPIMTT
mgnify:CR=1 FL=1